MNQEVIEQLQEVFPAQWFPNPIKGHNGLGWFLLEINPLPPLAELELVVSDIIRNNTVDVSWGQVRHSLECKRKHSIPYLVKRVIGNLKEQKFLVAIYPGAYGVYGGQPIAVAIEPQINYILYPDHPHLNPGHYTNRLDGKNLFIPDSFCYTDDPSKLGTDNFDRLLNSFCKISVWLLRHQVWLETRKINERLWIGLEGKPLQPSEYPLFLNPSGLCRCGNKKEYMNCHMMSDLESNAQDFAKRRKISNIDSIKRQLVFNHVRLWNSTKNIPQSNILNQFKKSMII
jgi:hypothetical protein